MDQKKDLQKEEILQSISTLEEKLMKLDQMAKLQDADALKNLAALMKEINQDEDEKD